MQFESFHWHCYNVLWATLYNYIASVHVKVGGTQGNQSPRVVPATTHGNKSHRVNWPFLLQNVVARTNLWQFECLGQVAATCLRTRPVIWDKSLRPVSPCKLFRRPVARSSRKDYQVPSCVATFSFILVQFSLLGGGERFLMRQSFHSRLLDMR